MIFPRSKVSIVRSAVTEDIEQHFFFKKKEHQFDIVSSDLSLFFKIHKGLMIWTN